jgi:hypothetical protein
MVNSPSIPLFIYFYSLIHMYIHCLGHFSPLPPASNLSLQQSLFPNPQALCCSCWQHYWRTKGPSSAAHTFLGTGYLHVQSLALWEDAVNREQRSANYHQLTWTGQLGVGQVSIQMSYKIKDFYLNKTNNSIDFCKSEEITKFLKQIRRK